MNKRVADVGLSFGRPIEPGELPDDPAVAIDQLQRLVEFGMG